MKKSVVGITACLVALAVATGVYANQSSEQRTATDGSSFGSISPELSQPAITNQAVSGTSGNFGYSVPIGYGYVKVFVQNNGTQRIAISLKKSSTTVFVPLAPANRTTYSTTNYVDPGKSISLWNNTPTGTGEHVVSLSSAGDMTGSTLTVKVGQQKSDLP